MIDILGLTPLQLLAFCAAVLLAAILRGFSGFGFALAAVPLISLVIAPASAIAVAILVQAIVGVRDILVLRSVLDRPGLLRLSAGALIGTPIGLFGLLFLDAATIRLAIAAIVGLGVLFLLRKAHPGSSPNLRLAAPTGIVAGLFSGLAAMPGPPVVAYYLSSATPAAVARASMMVFFFVTSLMSLPGLALGGLLDMRVIVLALIATPLMLSGNSLGHIAFKRAPSSAYKPIALIMLIAMALSSGLRGLSEFLG